MRRLKKIAILMVLLFGFLLVATPTDVGAKINPAVQHQEELKDEEQNSTGGSGCSSYVGEEKEQCEKDRKSTLKSADFVTKAILSLDNIVAEKEKELNYIKNFENSSSTAIAYAISLVDPETIVMWILNILTGLLEKLGLVVTLIVMVLYNVASSSFIQTVVRNVFDSLESILFVWDDPNSYIYKMIVVFGLVALVYRLIENKKQVITIGTVLNMFVQVLMSCILIVFIGSYGKPLVTNIEKMMQTALTETFSLQEDKGTPLEIQTKEMLFENLQTKAFVLRHFGVTEPEQIKKTEKIDNQKRVDVLLNDPSVANAKRERKTYDSEDISYNFVSCIKILGLSLMFLVHRLLLGAVFGVGALLLIILTLAKEILLGVSIFGVIFTLIKRDKNTLSWFINRMQWSILCILANSFYAIFLYFISYLVGQATAVGGIILMIPIDLAIFFGGKYALKKMPEWIEKVLSDFNLEGQSAFQVAKGFFTGDVSPQDAYRNRKDRNNSEDGDDDDIHEEKDISSNISDDMNHSDDKDLVDKADDPSEGEAGEGDETDNQEGPEDIDLTAEDLESSKLDDEVDDVAGLSAEDVEGVDESNSNDLDQADEDLKDYSEVQGNEDDIETENSSDDWDSLFPPETNDSPRMRDTVLDDAFFEETNGMEPFEDIEDEVNIDEESN